MNLIRIAPIAVSLSVLLATSAHAANGTWQASPTTGNWEATGAENNWGTAGAFPGSTSLTTNTDTATFLSSSTTSVLINSTAGNTSALNIKGINFGAATTALSSFTIGTTTGNGLLLTSGGVIQFVADTTPSNITETINAPIVIGTGSAAQTYSFTNNNATASNILVFGGGISGGTTGTTTLTLNGANAGANAVNGIISNGSGTMAVTVGGTANWTLGGANTYTGPTTISSGATLNISADNNLGAAPGSPTPNSLIIAGTLSTGTSVTINSNRGIGFGATNGGTGTFNIAAGKTLTYNGVAANGNGSDNFAVTGGGTLSFGGQNTYAGIATISGGSTLSTGATGYIGTSGVAGTVGASSYQPQSIVLNNGTFQDANTSSQQMYTQHGLTITTLGGTIDASGTSAIYMLNTLGLAVSGAGTHTLTLTGTNAGNNMYASTINDGTGVNLGTTSLVKNGVGTWVLAGTSTFTGGTTINSGTIVAESAAAFGTGNVTVAAGSGLLYEAPAVTTKLTIGGTLSIAGGTGTTLGGSIGSTAVNSEIAVTGAATGSGALTVNVYGTGAVAAGTSNYTLLTGGTGSALAFSSTSLGMVYNNSDFIVNSVASNSSTVTANITSKTALTTAYWVGGLSGAANVWAASNGSTASNWSGTLTSSTVQALTPGSTTDVVISNTQSVIHAPTDSVLGSNMSIKSLTVNDSNGLNLMADGNQLTVANGITINSTAGATTIGSNLAITTSTWTNNSSNVFTVSGTTNASAGALTVTGSGSTTISGELGLGHGTLIKSGTGTLTISGYNPNSYDRLTTVTAGELDLAKTGQVAATGGGLVGPTAIGGGLVIGNTTSPGAADSVVVKQFNNNQIALAGTGIVVGITVNSDGLLALNGFSDTMGSYASAGGDLTSTTPGGTLTLISATPAGGSLTAPTVAFNGTGATSTVGAGATITSTTATATIAATDGLTLNGTLSTAGGASLANGATTLSGTGTVTGAVTLNGGGNALSSTGTLTTGGLAVNGSGNTITSGTITGGGTIASAGTLVVNSAATLTGSLGVSSGGTLAGQGTVGNTTVATGGAINLQDSAVAALHTGTLSIGQGSGTALSFDIQTVSGTTSVDSIVAGTLTITGSGGIVINIGSLAGTSSLTTGVYTLISDTNGAALGSNPFTFTGGASSISLDGSTLTLINSASGLELNVAGAPVTPAVAYWSGSSNASWQTVGNFNTTATSGTAVGALPGSTTDVVFSTSTPTAANLSTTLDAATSINSLHFNSNSGNVTIASGTGGTASTLTIAAATTTGSSGVNTAPTGIALDSGAGNVTISAPIVLGASQTWTTSGSTSLAVSGVVSDGGNTRSLTKDGTGVLTLSGQNTYGGGTTVSSGTLVLSNGSGTASTTALNNTNGSATGSGALSVAAGATLAGKGTSQGSSFSISGTSGSKAQVLVGQNSAADTNTTGQLTALGASTSTITNANLTFNLNSAVVGQGNELNVGATSVAFGTGVTLTLNLQNAAIIPANSSYVLVAGTAVGTSAATSQYSGLTFSGSSTGNITTGLFTKIDLSGNGQGGNLSLALSGIAQNYYGNGSYLFLYQNSTTGQDDIEVEVVPEPGTWALMLGGLGVLIFWQRRRKS